MNTLVIRGQSRLAFPFQRSKEIKLVLLSTPKQLANYFCQIAGASPKKPPGDPPLRPRFSASQEDRETLEAVFQVKERYPIWEPSF